jgi:hypothetical protein
MLKKLMADKLAVTNTFDTKYHSPYSSTTNLAHSQLNHPQGNALFRGYTPLAVVSRARKTRINVEMGDLSTLKRLLMESTTNLAHPQLNHFTNGAILNITPVGTRLHNKQTPTNENFHRKTHLCIESRP